MRSKPATLDAALVAVKGQAAPSPDMPSRAGGPAIAAVPSPAPAAADPDEAQPKAGSRIPARARAAREPEIKEANLTPLNFRVQSSFRREFRTYAAAHDLKLNELLRLCFEAYRRLQKD
jgi:hypothetical protein